MNVDSHDKLPSDRNVPRNYQTIGNTDRETSYFLNMYLRDSRVLVPVGAGTNGDLHGRKAGYPNRPPDNPDAMRTALYFDRVNFASRIKAPALAGMGFIDTISPPAEVWTALNQIPGSKDPLPMIESEHDDLTPQKGIACPARTREILDLMVKAGEFNPGRSKQ